MRSVASNELIDWESSGNGIGDKVEIECQILFPKAGNLIQN